MSKNHQDEGIGTKTATSDWVAENYGSPDTAQNDCATFLEGQDQSDYIVYTSQKISGDRNFPLHSTLINAIEKPPTQCPSWIGLLWPLKVLSVAFTGSSRQLLPCPLILLCLMITFHWGFQRRI